MLPGAITIKTADPRMAAGRFTANKTISLRVGLALANGKPKNFETQRKGGNGGLDWKKRA